MSVNAMPVFLLIRNRVEPALKQSRSGSIPMRSRSDPDEPPFGQARKGLVRDITLIGVPVIGVPVIGVPASSQERPADVLVGSLSYCRWGHRQALPARTQAFLWWGHRQALPARTQAFLWWGHRQALPAKTLAFLKAGIPQSRHSSTLAFLNAGIPMAGIPNPILFLHLAIRI